MAPDFQWHQFPQAVEPGTRVAQVGEALRNVFDVYENVRVEAREFIDAGDKVVVVGRTHATARGSGMQVERGRPSLDRAGWQPDPQRGLHGSA